MASSPLAAEAPTRSGALAPARAWPEFESGMCERMNSEPCLVIATPSAADAAAIAATVDDILQTTHTPTSSSRAQANGTTAQREQPSANAPPTPTLHDMAKLMRVQFTLPEHIDMLQNCIAVHGRVPMLALVDMTDDEDGFSFVLDMAQPPDGGPTAEPPLGSHDTHSSATHNRAPGGEEGLRSGEGCLSRSSDGVVGAGETATTGPASEGAPCGGDAAAAAATAVVVGAQARERVRAFLSRVAAGVEPRAAQGAAPPVGDLVPPGHGVVLGDGRSATTSSWHRLLRSALATDGGGALAVFWSDRCPCCPGVLHLLDALVWGLRALFHGLLRTSGAQSPAATTTGTPHPLFPYLLCNIDENDYPAGDWLAKERAPTAALGEPPAEPQLVPCVVGYTHSGGLRRVPYTQSRTPTNLVRFLLDTCVSPALGSADLHRRFEAAAMAMAAAVDADALMEDFNEADPAYARARALHASLTKDDPPEVIAAVANELSSIRRAHLRQCCARRGCPSVEVVVERLLARSAGGASVWGTEGVEKSMPLSTAGGSGGEESGCCMAKPRSRSGSSSPEPMSVTVAVAGVKRSRDDPVGDGVDRS